MAKKGKSAALSFLPEDAIESGLFSSGPAKIKESIFARYNYGGNTKPTPVWLVTYSRDGEEDYEQPYSLGKGWKVSEDGMEVIPLNGQTGLPKSCNAMKYLVTPLYEALQAADLDPRDFLTGDPSKLDGLDVVVKRTAQEKREGLPGRKKDDDKERSILVIEEVVDAEGGSKPSKSKTKAKKSRDDDDEDDDDDDEDNEKPKAKSKGKAKADDDDDDETDDDDDEDDEDEKPAKGKPAKAKGSAKGKAKADDEDEDEDNELDEEATEALVAALEAEDGPIKVRDLQTALMDALKGNPQRKAIAARACEEDFLEKETRWSFNGKVVEAS